MEDKLQYSFIQYINENQGIAYKVLRVYFPDPHEREDAMQEMMYQLWRSYPGFDGRSKFSTWMYRVCLNTALTMKRNTKRKRSELLLPAHQEIAQDVSANNDHEVGLLFEAISSLNPLNKAIILLYLENKAYEEIASILGISRSNVSVRLVRIKKELETHLKQMIKPNSDVNI